MDFDKEKYLLSPVSNYLRENGFVLQKQELKFYDYKIDIYGFSLDKNLSIAIELKLNNWRKAIKQALIYQLCSDLVFIAMPYFNYKNINMEQLINHGIGLITVNENGCCEELIKSSISKVVHKHYKEEYLNILKMEL